MDIDVTFMYNCTTVETRIKELWLLDHHGWLTMNPIVVASFCQKVTKLPLPCLNETLHLLTPWWGKWGLFYAEDILSKCEIQLVSFEYEYVNLVAAVIVRFSLQQLNAEYSKQASIWKFTGRPRGGDRLITVRGETRYYYKHRQLLFRS